MNRLSVGLIGETKLFKELIYEQTKMTKPVYALKIRVFRVLFIGLIPVCVEFVNDFTFGRMGL